jgi:L-rhamnose mutarotase
MNKKSDQRKRPERKESREEMIKRAFTMKLKPGGLAEYKRHHDSIWPELVAEIERQGIAQITIFENDPVLFLYSEISDPEAWDRLWHTEIHDKWGEYMAPLMVFNDEGIVDSSEVRQVFDLRTNAGKK